MPRCDLYIIAEQNALIVSLVFQRVHPVASRGNTYVCLHNTQYWSVANVVYSVYSRLKAILGADGVEFCMVCAQEWGERRLMNYRASSFG